MTPALLPHWTSGPPDAPAVLFLHGFMGQHADWDACLAAWPQPVRSITVDLPGHGAAASWPEAYTLPNTQQAVLNLIEALHLDTVHLVGYSMGGRVALHLLLNHPDRFERAALVSASPGLRTEAARQERQRHDAALAARLVRDRMEAFLPPWYQQSVFASLAQRPDLRQAFIRQRAHNDPEALAAVLRGMGTGEQANLWERLGALRVSTLALAGALDPAYVDQVQRMAQKAPAVQATVLAEAGHTLHRERPAQLAAALHAHLLDA
ncbi:MAG: 2-succinyl-6-hydroxy-2,4-cyclohexadiene-1-carboxylate synthase [Bacteroidota bacterium]